MADKGCALLPLCPDPSPFQMPAVPGSVLSIPPPSGHRGQEGQAEQWLLGQREGAALLSRRGTFVPN